MQKNSVPDAQVILIMRECADAQKLQQAQSCALL